MVPTVRRTATAAVAPAPVGVNFLELEFYSGGFNIPEGDYVIADITILEYQYTKADGTPTGTPPVLGAMVTLQAMAEPAAEFRKQFYGMGKTANKSFMANPETGKSLISVPGGAAAGLNNMTNWAVFLKSLYDSGLPQGTVSNDVSVLEGTHCHMASVPEPKERSGFQSNTAEVQQEKKNNLILVVTEIKEDGKPWENTGGLLAADAPAPAVAGKPVAAKPVAGRAPVRAAAPVVPAAVEEGTDDAIRDAAIDGITAALEVTPTPTKLQLRTGAFKAITAAHGKDMATAVVDTYFSDATIPALQDILGTVFGYKMVGTNVLPA